MPEMNTGSPAPYDFVMTLDTPFLRDMTEGLVIEFFGTAATGFPSETATSAGIMPPTSWRIYNADLVAAGGDQTYHSLLVTYVPEPATMILLALGGLLAIRRKR